MSETRRGLSTFQIHLTVTAAAVTAGFALVIGLSLFVPLGMQLGRGDLDAETMGGIARYALDLHRTFWPVMLVCVGGSIASGLIFYRRMTSPLVRFARAFEAISRGEQPEPIVIRETDYLVEQAEVVNRMLSALRARANERERAVEEILRIADDLSALGSSAPDVRDLARELRDAAKVVG
jgi:methyl-accepting chemotaxis protein